MSTVFMVIQLVPSISSIYHPFSLKSIIIVINTHVYATILDPINFGAH